MSHLLEPVANWIENLIATIGYPGIVVVMAIENIFPPIPSELVLPFAGSLSAKGEMNFWAAVAAGTIGALIGAIVLYAVGYFAREAGVRTLVVNYGKYLFISERDLDRAADWFETIRRDHYLLRTPYTPHPQHHLHPRRLHPHEPRSILGLHNPRHNRLEPNPHLRRSSSRRKLGKHPNLHGHISIRNISRHIDRSNRLLSMANHQASPNA